MNPASVRKLSLLLIALAFAGLALRDGDGGGILPSEKLIPVDGVAVLIVEETDQRAALPTEQQNILLGQEWTDKVPRGNYRILDKDATFTQPSPFKAAFERPRESLPWLIVSGKRNYEGPLPGTVTEVVQKIEAAQ